MGKRDMQKALIVMLFLIRGQNTTFTSTIRAGDGNIFYIRVIEYIIYCFSINI